MSVVAGKVYDDRIVMAADSIIVKGGWGKRSGFSKLVNINDMIIGGTGTAEELSLFFRFAQTHRPETPTEKDVLSFVVEFATWKRDYSINTIENTYLLGISGHLFLLDKMFVNEVLDFEAIGAGEDFANAALFLGHTPEEAVKVACELCCYVSEPIEQYVMNRR